MQGLPGVLRQEWDITLCRLVVGLLAAKLAYTLEVWLNLRPGRYFGYSPFDGVGWMGGWWVGWEGAFGALTLFNEQRRPRRL